MLEVAEARQRIQAGLLARDQNGLATTLIAVNHDLGPEMTTVIVQQEFEHLPPETHAWWCEPCDLCIQAESGHLPN